MFLRLSLSLPCIFTAELDKSKMNNKNLNLGLAIVMFFGTSYMAFKKEKREDYDKLDTRSLAEEYVKLIKANEIVKNYKQVELK